MKSFTNVRFWIIGSALSAVPAAAMLRDYQLLTPNGWLNGWPKMIIDRFEFWRDHGKGLLADMLELLAAAVRAMADDAVNIIIILLALYLATLVSGFNDDDSDINGDDGGDDGSEGKTIRRN